MKILILGNGFDLAHGLPTQYGDFLEICSLARNLEVTWHGQEVSIAGANEKKEVLKSFCEAIQDEQFKKFRKIARNSFWINHFTVRSGVIGNKWLNFEDEIKIVAEAVVQEKKAVKMDFVERVSNETLHAFCKENSFYQNYKTFNDLFDLILNEHKKLIKALAIYMHEYIAKKEVKPISFIKNNVFDKVLSFNYTDTYATNYDSDIDCCYIHGKATVDKKTPCNMVLGFDDHYLKDASVVPEIVPFEKYYQRIVNRTDNQYFEWLEEMKTEENTVYIYGHSLAPADGDVLGQFILALNTKTVIYYLNESDRAEKVKNLAIVLGPNKLIQLTGGKNPVIRFEEIK